MPKRLTNIRLNFLSGVDNPANQHSEVILMKRREAKGQPDVGDVHIQTATGAIVASGKSIGKLARLLAKMRGDVPPAFRSVVKDAVTFGDVIDERETAELIDALTSTLWDICYDDDTPQDAKRPLIVQALKDFYAALAASDSAEPDNPITKEIDDMKPEEIQAAVDAAVAKAIPAAVEPVKVDLAKAVAENAALLAKNAELATTVETLRKTDARRTLIAKAEAVIKESGAVAKAEDVADLLEGASEAHQEKILAMVKQNGTLAAEGAIFKALGVTGEEHPVGPDAEIEKLAIAKQAANPGMRIETARAKVLEDNPHLYDEQQEAAAAAAAQ